MNSENFLCRNDVVDAVEIPRAIDVREGMEKNGFASGAMVRNGAVTCGVRAQLSVDVQVPDFFAVQRYPDQTNHAGLGDAPVQGASWTRWSRRSLELVSGDCWSSLAVLARKDRGSVVQIGTSRETVPEMVGRMSAKAVRTIKMGLLNCGGIAWLLCAVSARSNSASLRGVH